MIDEFHNLFVWLLEEIRNFFMQPRENLRYFPWSFEEICDFCLELLEKILNFFFSTTWWNSRFSSAFIWQNWRWSFDEILDFFIYFFSPVISWWNLWFFLQPIDEISDLIHNCLRKFATVWWNSQFFLFRTNWQIGFAEFGQKLIIHRRITCPYLVSPSKNMSE